MDSHCNWNRDSLETTTEVANIQHYTRDYKEKLRGKYVLNQVQVESMFMEEYFLITISSYDL